MTWHYRAPPGRAKHDKERTRGERRAAKAEKAVQRRADKPAGVPIDILPLDFQGLARFISGADQ